MQPSASRYNYRTKKFDYLKTAWETELTDIRGGLEDTIANLKWRYPGIQMETEDLEALLGDLDKILNREHPFEEED